MDEGKKQGESRKSKSGKSSGVKNLMIFIAIMLASMFFGACIGAAISYGKHSGVDFKGVLSSVGDFVMRVLPTVYIILSAVSFVLALGLFMVYRRMVHEWDGEDEDVLQRIEGGLGTPVLIANGMMVFNVLLFSMHVWNTLCTDCDGLGLSGSKLFGTMLFLINYIWIIAVNRLVVELEKKLNPEKRGDVLETDFSRKWEDSCDEAQKMIIYEAGYRAYRMGTTACNALWLVSFISMFAFDTGLMPIFVVCAIWFIMMIRYTVAADKLEKKMYR